MDLRDAMVRQKPRESSGSRTANRFDFQKDWALLKLLELHSEATDYLLVLDYHDDIVLLDNENAPSEMKFYQIKTKNDGNWTVKGLIRRNKDKDGRYLLSIIGKMYDSKLKFPLHAVELNLVSNARFNLTMKNGTDKTLSKQHVCVADLDVSQIAEMHEAVKSEHGLSGELSFANITFFRVTDLAVSGHDKYVRGELGDFLERSYPPPRKFRLGAIYRALFEEIKRRTNYEWEIEDYNAILKYKAISKREFQTLLDTSVAVGKDFDEVWKMIETRLQVEAVPLSEIHRIRNGWTTTEVRQMEPTDSYFHAARTRIATMSMPFRSATGLYSAVLEVYRQYSESGEEYIYDEHEVKAMILWELSA